MRKIVLIISSIILFYTGCQPDSGNICIYENKNVTVLNNTGYEILVIIKGTPIYYYPERVLGTIQPFQFKEFNVPHSVAMQAGVDDGNVFFYDELYIDPCFRNFELIVDN